MKLKTKLIPLTGLAAIGATIAPIATSCGIVTSWVDLKQDYKSTVTALDSQTLTYTQAYEKYFGKTGDWKKEEDVLKQFKDDYLWSHALTAKNPNNNYDSAKVKFSDMRVSHPSFKETETSETTEVAALTFTLEYDFTTTNVNGDVTTVTTSTGTSKIYNVPYVCYHDGSSLYPVDVWYIGVYSDLLKYNESFKSQFVWNVTTEQTQTTTTTNAETGVQTIVTNTSKESYYTGCGSTQIGVLTDYYNIDAVSHYLFNCEYSRHE